MTQTIKTKELSKIISSISISTLQIYLSNYKFNKYRVSHTDGINALFKINTGFLNTLYTYFWHKGRDEEAKMLKKHFKDYDVKALCWEEFVR
jgi:uncharacterized membrane protein YkgB